MGHTPEEDESTDGWSGGMACKSNLRFGLYDDDKDDDDDELDTEDDKEDDNGAEDDEEDGYRGL